MDISFPSAKFAYLWRSAQIGFKLPSFKTHNSDFELTGSKHNASASERVMAIAVMHARARVMGPRSWKAITLVIFQNCRYSMNTRFKE
jgi:hypothetical protein